MSNELVIIPENIPAYCINPELAKQVNVEALSGVSTGAPPRIGCKSTRFKVTIDGEDKIVPPSDLVDGTYLRVVVLRAKAAISKAFYATKYVEGQDNAPDCFSDDGVTPDPSSPSKQCETCAGCPHNAFGSGTNAAGEPSKGKACSDTKKLAVFASFKSLGIGGVFELRIMPTALKSWGKYVKTLTDRGIPVSVVQTFVKFNDQANFPSFEFSFGGFLDEKVIGKLSAMGQTQEVLDIVEPMRNIAALPAPVKTNVVPMTKEAAPSADDLGLGLDDEAEKKKAAEAAARKKADDEKKKAAAAAKKKAEEEAAAAKAAAEASDSTGELDDDDLAAALGL